MAIREVLMIPCGGLELHVCVADFADAAAHRFPKTPAPFADCTKSGSSQPLSRLEKEALM